MREVGVKIGLYSTRVIEESFEGGWSQNWTLQYKSKIGMFGGTFGVKIELTVQEL